LSDEQLPCEKEWLDCTRCDLHKTRTRVVIGYGSRRAKLMFIGEGPGGLEDEEGRPFVGPAGELFDDYLRHLKLSRDNIMLNNIVACRAFIQEDDGSRRDRPPKKPEILACKDRLLEAIYTVDPVLIVAMGSVAFKALTGETTSITKARGGIYEMKVPGWEAEEITYNVLATFHPSYLKRNPQERRKNGSIWEQFLDDLSLAVQMVEIADERYSRR